MCFIFNVLLASSEDSFEGTDEQMISIDELINKPNIKQEVEMTNITETRPLSPVTSKTITQQPDIVKSTVFSSPKTTSAKQIILKPIAVLNNPSNNTEVRSHIKIGNNIFAIVQKNDNTQHIQSVTSTVGSINANSVTNQSTVGNKTYYNRNSKIINEHDYADDKDDELLETGVSKVSIYYCY